MIRIRLLAGSVALGLSLLVTRPLVADEVRTFVEGGIKYQETTQVVQRLIPDTRYEQREYTHHQERYTTDMQEVQRTYQVPVTRQEWVPGYHRTWNVFAPPVLSYRLIPVTRLETRSETVRVPVTKREFVPEKRVLQVPVPNSKLAEEKHVHRIALGTVQGEGGPLVANREDAAGGTKVEGDPPRSGTWNGTLETRRP